MIFTRTFLRTLSSAGCAGDPPSVARGRNNPPQQFSDLKYSRPHGQYLPELASNEIEQRMTTEADPCWGTEHSSTIHMHSQQQTFTHAHDTVYSDFPETYHDYMHEPDVIDVPELCRQERAYKHEYPDNVSKHI